MSIQAADGVTRITTVRIANPVSRICPALVMATLDGCTSPWNSPLA
jgi:hypothetical protein